MSRTFIIGDIHGCYDELIALTEKIGLQQNDLLISVGDILDRGSKSKEVYHYFRNRPNSIVLMGNHERKHLNQVLSYAQDIVKLQFGTTYPELLEWIAQLGYFYETEEAIIVHAAFENKIPLQYQREEVLSGSTAGERYLEKIYGNSASWPEHYQGTKTIIYGHHVTGDLPEKNGNTLGIDTGACHGGYLTAVELPGFHVHQVKAAKDYWKEEQATWQIPVLKAKDWDNMTFENISKQLDKLAYIEAPEVRNFLSGIATETTALIASYEQLLTATHTFAAALQTIHGEQFAQAASEYVFKTSLFKAKSNTLTKEDLAKTLNTPAKVKAYTQAIAAVPDRP